MLRDEIGVLAEPIAGALDLDNDRVVKEPVQQGRSGRKTVLFVTHQIDEAVFLADRVLVFGRRPGRIQDTIEIQLPRPRALSLKRTPDFVAYVDRIWRLIEDDVRTSVIEERV